MCNTDSDEFQNASVTCLVSVITTYVKHYNYKNENLTKASNSKALVTSLIRQMIKGSGDYLPTTHVKKLK